MPAEDDATTVTCPNSIMFGEWLRRIQGHMALARNQESESVAENTLLKMRHLMVSILNSQYNHENRLSDVLDKARGETRIKEWSTARTELAKLICGLTGMIDTNWQLTLECRRPETPTRLAVPKGLDLPVQSLEGASLRRGDLVRYCEQALCAREARIFMGMSEDIRKYLAHALGTDQISSESAMRLMALHDALRKNDLEYNRSLSTYPLETPTQRAARQAECVRKFREYVREIRGILGEG
jgi:hypothetical protein